ncbi:hypothetical protein RirG_114490 [Rhizophagus irregularis DAOM 197198w]|uniref:Uncharacterized protein n=1 Tax=Rhizophagus irregularis (strain DAOM 197198w) TaxID=1432141 RepID=A0A015JD58_RHIIW|nr:hypothetical protein RirG_114490 [Rhizophagus irregularis DAOM 197198w]
MNIVNAPTLRAQYGAALLLAKDGHRTYRSYSVPGLVGPDRGLTFFLGPVPRTDQSSYRSSYNK